MKNIFTALILFVASYHQLIAGSEALFENIGKGDFSDWKGVSVVDKDRAVALTNNTITYRYVDGKRYNKGFRRIDEGVKNYTPYYGIRFWIYLEKDEHTSLQVTLRTANYNKDYLQSEIQANVAISNKGWQQIIIPFKSFGIKTAQRQAFLQAVKEVSIKQTSSNNQQVLIKQVQLTQGEVLVVRTDIKGKSGAKGATVTYELNVGNTSDKVQSVNLSTTQYGWESMVTSIEPAEFELKPAESKNCIVTVKIADRVPAGGREKQNIVVMANGRQLPDASIELITASTLPSPNILHTADRWQVVRDKVMNYDWAKKEKDKYIQLADKWIVPALATELTNDNADKGMQLFQTQEEYNLMASGIAYQLTGDKKYAENIAVFMRRLSDPIMGYSSTFRGCHQSFVQEGHFFQHIAMAYDMVKTANVFSPIDEQNIEHTFRVFIETVQLDMRQGAINNWKLSEMCGALYCALAIQDWHLVEDIFYSPSAIVDHLAHGVMNDGWWYECSVGYNVWCATEFSQVALALAPWGINFKDMQVPIGTTPYYSLMPGAIKGTGKNGINFDKWGLIKKNSICLKDMWDAIPKFADYRGVMFGVNDAQETMVGGEGYDLAYYLFHDPEYAAIVKRGTTRDLLYGEADLPETNSVLDKQSAYADNMGIVMLRSQKEGRPINEQIQASLHYGTHGGAHGHFDRTGLLSMSRYGRSFFNPEMVWYGYPSYMYKFYVQTSLTKNMVVVDQKMQEATESFQKLFYTGKMMQASLVETKSRWSNPPYGGMMYDWAGNISFAEKTWQEGQSIFVPQKTPEYGQVTGHTEPIQQQRLMVMTDDYIVLADYLKGEQEHTYDCLFQMKGFQGLEATNKKFIKHDTQMNTDPLGSAQFITDCNWWAVNGTSKASFFTCWGKDCDNTGTRVPFSADGDLKIDVFSAWPQQKELMIGTAAEAHPVAKQVHFAIRSGGKTLQEGKTGTWVLGAVEINQAINNITTLELVTTTNSDKTNTLFWGNARIVLKNGKEILISSLLQKKKNIQTPAQEGKDYYGGPIKIAGNVIETALPAMPTSTKDTAITVIDLSGVKAVAFKAILGGDYPLGNEDARRKTYSSRSKGKEANFLTVVEPYEKQSIIKKVEALTSNKVRIELKDGRVQEITIDKLNGSNPKINIVEILNDKVLRTETSN